MATKIQTGNNPLDIPRIDASKGGVNAAFAKISEEIAKRTPRQSLTAGSLQTHNGRFDVPATRRRPQSSPHAWWAFLFTDMETGDAKATFTEGFVYDVLEGAITDPFDDEEDRTRTISVDEVYYVKVTHNETGKVTEADFDTYIDPKNTSTERYLKIVEFVEGDIPGTFSPLYYRYDSIEWLLPTHPWKVTTKSDNEVTVAAGELLTVRNDIIPALGVHPAWVRQQSASSFDGGDVTVTASGYIYGVADQTNGDKMLAQELPVSDDVNTASLDLFRTIPAGDIGVAFSESLPTESGFLFIIAEVTFDGSVVAITKQVITHNPTMWHMEVPDPP